MRTEHPRLLFDRSRIDRLRRQIRADAGAAALWQRIAESADALLSRPLIAEEEADGPDTQHGDYGRPGNQIMDMGLILGLVHCLTGEGRYADRLAEALLHYTRYRKWYGRGLRRNDPPWHSELNTARFCFGCAAGYDAIADALSPVQRAEIASGMIDLGILPTLEDWVLPERRVHALDSMGHNWWSVCVAQAGFAALALVGEDPRAEGWARAVSDGLEAWFDYRGFPLQNKSPNFDPAGGFYESVNYTDYALAEYLLFRLAYAQTLGNAPDMPLLPRVADFFLHTCYPTSSGLLTVNFGDGDLHGDAGRAVTLLILSGVEEPALRWYAGRARTPERPFALLARDATAPSARPDHLGRSALYPEIGWATLRTSWEDDATLLAVKCGFTWNHAHADAGSFVLFHAGRPLLLDAGSCAYGRPEYHGYYCQSRAHNVVLVDGVGQPPEDIHRGVKHPGRLHHLLQRDGLRYLLADAAGPMSHQLSRHYRHFLWIGRALLVLDDVRAHAAGRIAWLLHHGGRATPGDGRDIHIEDGPARLVVRPLHPARLDVGTAQGLVDHRPDETVAYLIFTQPDPEREAKFLTAYLPCPPDGSPLPAVEAVSGPEWLGARVRQDGRRTDVYLNLRADGRRMHRNSNHVLEGWETDAAVLAVTAPAGAEPGTAEQIFIGGGSYLRRAGGPVLFDSLSKAFAICTAGPAGLDVQVRGQPRLALRLGAPTRPGHVTVNGVEFPFTFDAERRLVGVAGTAPSG